MTAYIIDKKGFNLMYNILGGIKPLPQALAAQITDENSVNILERLEMTGYIHTADKRVNIERTIDFLIRSVTAAEECIEHEKDKRYVFFCSKLIIVIECDSYSKNKLKLIPIKDNEMLEQYYNQLSEEDTE